MTSPSFANPFRPGAGHMPPYLAGREAEKLDFLRQLKQDVILENLILTGLRGVGKTVLLDTFKPLAIEKGWLWAGTDLSESVSLTEERMAIRLLTDLSLVTSSITLTSKQIKNIGFVPQIKDVTHYLDYHFLKAFYDQTPGMASDKLKAVLELSWKWLQSLQRPGLVFSYDESQNLADHTAQGEFPLSLLLDVFQSIQKKNIPFMLVLTGLPTLFPKLVEARTFAERMFHVMFLDRLNESDSRDAIQKPIQDAKCPLPMGTKMINRIVNISGGYPYFIQFLGREVYDVVLQLMTRDGTQKAGRFPVPFDQIIRKLDTDFFTSRWSKATDRQKQLLTVVARLPNSDREFTVQEVVEKSKEVLGKPFSSSHTNQMLVKLSDAGLVYKNRHGRYSFAVPLMNRFIIRQAESSI
ncbi:MAG: ATP-binding protein [Isosphaerales bacterium]